MGIAKSQRVYIVDDDKLIRKMLTHHLAADGYDIEEFADGRDALEAIRAERPDVVIADWNMPNMSGVELCRAIRADEKLDTLYFLLLTSNADKSSVVEGLTVGADDYIVKPYKRDELLARVRVGCRIIEMQEKVAQRAEIEAQRDRLSKALDALKQVLIMVGHELRTPLAALRALSEFLMTEEARQSEQWSDFMKTINDEVIKMSDMVNNMLEVIRLQSGQADWHWGQVNLQAVCEEVVSQCEKLIDTTAVRMSWQVQPSSLRMKGDSEAISRLLTNLLHNAIEHTHGGEIGLNVQAAAMPEGEGIQIVVEDTGTGIAPAILDKLGHAFALSAGFFGSDYIKGTGLGLAICKGIVAAHGGTICVDSERDKGTAFTVCLRSDLGGPLREKKEVEILQQKGAAV